jgi:hypothetical protein
VECVKTTTPRYMLNEDEGYSYFSDEDDGEETTMDQLMSLSRDPSVSSLSLQLPQIEPSEAPLLSTTASQELISPFPSFSIYLKKIDGKLAYDWESIVDLQRRLRIIRWKQKKISILNGDNTPKRSRSFSTKNYAEIFFRYPKRQSYA